MKVEIRQEVLKLSALRLDYICYSNMSFKLFVLYKIQFMIQMHEQIKIQVLVGLGLELSPIFCLFRW